MENKQTILAGHSDQEKGAYLGAIASIATADRQATKEELESLAELCDAAQINKQQKEAVLHAAGTITDDELIKCLDILKNSDLRYSLVTDLIAFAKADSDYNEAEQQQVQEIAQYLGVNQQQFSLLDQFTNKAANAQVTPEEAKQPGFLSTLGLDDKMKNAGINGSSLLRGLLTIAAPLLLTRMVTNKLGRGSGGMFGGSRRRGGGMFGGGGPGGNMGGGLGGLFGGGGLGSLIGMFNGGRGYGNAGGMFDRILRNL
ncbi:TerB family tellurite resistance protein [Ilyomonas limi]|nr:TerB family tellurite resistance protein [Ilyomonas limi]